MSNDVVIRVENLSKKYTLKHQSGQKSGDGIRHAIQDAVSAPFKRLNAKHHSPLSTFNPKLSTSAASSEEFYALRDVCFEVRRGEVLGIIGRNGAGKSTLLKILSRITEPTSGCVGIKGRVASLLEVGTGFHPELSGRENIFLNGAILGMSRAEVKRKFDEIVAFAEVEKFLDTPVKRYSSGMYVRLAFAVAAHLEPEILIVDEVLAVGDAQFQKKCLGKMKEVSSQGRTVFFVSHQTSAVTRLCQKALWLEKGNVVELGIANAVCSNYLLNGNPATGEARWVGSSSKPGNEWVRLEFVEAHSENCITDTVNITTPIEIHFGYRVLQHGKILIPNIHFYSDDGTLIFISHDWYSGWREEPRPAGLYKTIFTVPGNFFSEGRISVNVAISTYTPFEVHFEESDAAAFSVIESDSSHSSRGDYTGPLPGLVRPLLHARTECMTSIRA